MADYSARSQRLDAQSYQMDYGTILELLEIDATAIGGTVHRITPSRDQDQGIVTFLGMPFVSIPFQSEGWAWDGTGNSPRPTITIADVDGLLLTEVIAFKDLVGITVKRWTTTKELLDTGTYRGPEIWYIVKKAEADGTFITFELGTVLDRNTMMLPRRQMLKDDFPALGRTRMR